MEVTSIGNNTITACVNCDDLIAVKAADYGDGLSLVQEAHKAHLESRPECKAYYDALPTLGETMDAIRKISEDRHAAHTCTPGACECKCGCGIEVECVEDLDDGICWTCALRVMRDDDEHGDKDSAEGATKTMSNYHGQLMNIPGDPAIENRESGYREIYKRGHRDARHAAAEQVGIAADRRIAELEAQAAAAEGLAAALRRLEWSEKRGNTPTCPVCFGMKPPRDGHDNNCQIGQALAAWDAAKEGKR